ncbi:MAG TPA: hypothetical protein VIU61_28215, partial [Kofleriaceae bacterium]
MRTFLLLACVLCPIDALACPDIGPFNPRFVSFGQVPVGVTSAPRNVEFYNHGTEAGSLCTWMIDNGSFALDEWCKHIQPGETVNFAVTCRPLFAGDHGAIWNLRSGPDGCDREFEEYLGCVGGPLDVPLDVTLPSVQPFQTSQTTFTITNADGNS